jgi:hypothetical protein
MRKTLGLVALAAIMLFTISAGQALANHVQCGDVITQNTTLDSDVVCEGETYGVTAITIAADNVTLDLNGYTVRGAYSFEDATSNGVATDAPRTGLAVVHGTIIGFTRGVALEVSNSVVRNLILDDGSTGVDVRGDNNTLTRNRSHNGGFAGIIVRGDGSVLDRNVADGSEFCVRAIGDQLSITRNTVTGCIVGISVEGYSTALVARNTSAGSQDGIDVFGSGARVEHNTASGNSRGIAVVDPQALVLHNVASDNSVGSGIESSAPGTTLTRNRADRNANYGIEAPGAVDGGGNRAKHNGNPAQCLGVSCR